jgi:hypothetical protein
MPAPVLRDLRKLWLSRHCQDEYVGTLVNAYLAAGGRASGIKAGHAYVDVGTLHGYRAAMTLLGGNTGQAAARVTLGWPDGCLARTHRHDLDSSVVR